MGTAASSVEEVELNMNSDMCIYFNTMEIVYDADSESYVEPEESDLHSSWEDASKSANQLIHSNFCEWNFDVFALKRKDLGYLSGLIIEKSGMSGKGQIEPSKWARFSSAVSGLMGKYNNPYHNYWHVTDVMHSVFSFIKNYGAGDILSDIQQYSLLIAAFVHDLDHPGTSAPYLINSKHPLSFIYTESLLENYHIAKAFTLMNNEKFDILANFSSDEKKQIKKYMIDTIRATDIAFHFSLKSELEKVVESVEAITNESGNYEFSEADKLVIMKALIHAADISNPAKQWNISKEWSDRVLKEFFQQGDREKQEGLPVTMNCDRDTVFQDELSLNFCDFIVAPFFYALSMLLPKLHPICLEIQVNRDRWNRQLQDRIREGSSVEESQKTEILEKWKNREGAFNTLTEKTITRCSSKLKVSQSTPNL